jgi:hypothetical protein
MRIKRKLYSDNKLKQPDPTKLQRLALDQQHQAIQQNKLSISQINALTNTQRTAIQPVKNQLQAQRNGIEGIKASSRLRNVIKGRLDKSEGKYIKPDYSEGKPKRVVGMKN